MATAVAAVFDSEARACLLFLQGEDDDGRDRAKPVAPTKEEIYKASYSVRTFISLPLLFLVINTSFRGAEA